MPKDEAHVLLRTVPETAKMLGCGRNKVYELIAARKILAVKDGHSTRVVDASIHRYVRSLIAKAQGLEEDDPAAGSGSDGL